MLQQDSLDRITRYQRLKDEAVQCGNAKMVKLWQREIADEQKTLAVIVRVERLNSEGALEGYMRIFRERHRSKELVAV